MGKINGNGEERFLRWSLSLFWTQGREAFADYALSHPIHQSKFNLFVPTGHKFSFKSIGDLHDKRIGMNRGFVVNAEFDEAVRRGLIISEEVEGINYNIKKLLNGRIDAVADNYHVTRYQLRKMGVTDKIVALPEPLIKSRNAYLVLSHTAQIKGRASLLKKINQSLEAIYQDGTYQYIVDKYLK